MRAESRYLIWAILVLTGSLFLMVSPHTSAQPVRIPHVTSEQGRAFSEFNHRLVGFFLLVVGILAVLSRGSAKLSFLGKVAFSFHPLRFVSRAHERSGSLADGNRELVRCLHKECPSCLSSGRHSFQVWESFSSFIPNSSVTSRASPAVFRGNN